MGHINFDVTHRIDSVLLSIKECPHWKSIPYLVSSSLDSLQRPEAYSCVHKLGMLFLDTNLTQFYESYESGIGSRPL